ncbi:MAG: IS1595 family transposase [Muribaculaceae bacterium]|nr:IS1595 family transposase [Muribaculaceae bacterium]
MDATINFGNFNSLYDFFEAFPDEKACISFLEKKRWSNGVVSPYDATSKVYRRGDGNYRCKNTGKNFNVRIGTIFEGTKLPLRKWFMSIYLLCNHKKAISATQLAKDINVTLKTAWFLLHKIRKTFHTVHLEKLDGEVELDEAFVGGKNKNRHANKKVKNSQGRSFKDKVPVLGMLQRGGNVICKVVKDTSAKSLTPCILKAVKRTANLFTDEWVGYDIIRKIYKTQMVDHGKGQYVIGNAYTNSIEGFWSNFCKRVINAIYNHVGRKYMQRYFDEFSFRYNTRNVSNKVRFDMVIVNTYIRVTQNQIVGK